MMDEVIITEVLVLETVMSIAAALLWSPAFYWVMFKYISQYIKLSPNCYLLLGCMVSNGDSLTDPWKCVLSSNLSFRVILLILFFVSIITYEVHCQS